MEYLDNQHKILKYFCKFRYGVLFAHKKCLKDTGEDYSKLSKTCQKISYKDAVVDMDKLKALFVERTIMTADEFDTALKGLISAGYMTKDYYLTKEGKAKNKEVFKAYYASDTFTKSPEYKEIDTTKLLFND